MKQITAAHIRPAAQDRSVDVGHRYVTLVLYTAAAHVGKACRGSQYLISISLKSIRQIKTKSVYAFEDKLIYEFFKYLENKFHFGLFMDS